MPVLVTGNTYPVKDRLKQLGGRWNPEKKGWEVPDAQASAAKAIVAGGSATPLSHTHKNRAWGGKCREKGCSSAAVRDGYCARCHFDEFDN
jgi:hypothetical protein